MDITQRGEIYGIGQGEDFYGIWDLRAEGAPVNRYPKTPEGWQGAWERWRELEGEFGRPPWRRPSLGMILLHTVIGLTFGFLSLALAGVVLGAAGREISDTDAQTQIGLVGLLQWILTLTGWLLFVYLKARPPARWIIFLGLFLAGMAVTVGVGFSILPEA